MQVKERIVYIDQLKGVAIFLVVLGHFLQYNTVESKSGKLFEIIYSFHMPLFMFISGYVAFKTIRQMDLDNYFLFLKKKAIGILIPFFSWPLLVNPLFFNNDITYNPKSVLLGIITNPAGGLWFLWYLFLFYLIYTLFLRASNKFNRQKKFFIDIVFLLILTLPLLMLRQFQVVNYADSLLLHYIFFFSGIFLSKYDFIQVVVLKNITFSISIFIFSTLCSYYDFLSSSIINLLLKMVLSTAAIICIYYIVRSIKWTLWADKYIQALGKNSLVIYVTQFSIIYVLPSTLLLDKMNFLLLISISIVFSVLIIVVCLMIMRIAQLSRVLNFTLYGRLKPV